MSRSISAALAAHLSGSVLTVCTCIKITRLDGVVIGLTDFDQPLVFAGVVYSPLDGASATAIRTSVSSGIDNVEVVGLLDSHLITSVDLLGGKYDNASVSIFQVNYTQKPLTDQLVLVTGYLGAVTVAGSGFHAEVNGLSHRLSQPIVEHTSPTCRVWTLGDQRCRIKLDAVPISAITQASPVRITTTVPHGRVGGDSVWVQDVLGMTGINGHLAVVASVPTSTQMTLNNTDGTPLNSSGYAAYTSGGQIGWRVVRTVTLVDGPPVASTGDCAQRLVFGSDNNPISFYEYGTCSFLTGANQGVSREVKSNPKPVNGVADLRLAEAFPFPVAVGDTARLEAGCNRTVETCLSRFFNVVNFRGENLIAGQDVLLRRARK